MTDKITAGAIALYRPVAAMKAEGASWAEVAMRTGGTSGKQAKARAKRLRKAAEREFHGMQSRALERAEEMIAEADYGNQG